jgi:hypothetical protein
MRERERERERATLLGPLEGANLRHCMLILSKELKILRAFFPSPQNGKDFSYRNVVF